MYRVEIWNRRTQAWEPADWIKPVPSEIDAYAARMRACWRGHTIYGDSRVVPVGQNVDVTL